MTAISAEESTDRHIGRAIHTELWERHITQRAFAAALGVDETNLSKMLRGKRGWTVDELCRAAKLLRVPVPKLLPQQLSIEWGGGDSNPEPDDYWDSFEREELARESFPNPRESRDDQRAAA